MLREKKTFYFLINLDLGQKFNYKNNRISAPKSPVVGIIYILNQIIRMTKYENKMK